MAIPYKNPARYQKSQALFQGSSVLIPGGVNSTARALWAGWEPHPLFVTHAEGSHLVDVDGNNYVDYLLGLGPMILGHRPSAVTQAVINQIEQKGNLKFKKEIRGRHKTLEAVPQACYA